MKTELEVKGELKTAKKDLKKTEAQFKRYDNYEDMEEIERLRAQIKMLEWVLS